MGNRLTQPGLGNENRFRQGMAEAAVDLVDGASVGRRGLFAAIGGGLALVVAGCGGNGEGRPMLATTSALDRPTGAVASPNATPSTVADPVGSLVRTEHGDQLRPGEGTYVFPGIAVAGNEVWVRPILDLERIDLVGGTSDVGKLAAAAYLSSEGVVTQEGGLPLKYWLNPNAETTPIDQKKHDAFAIDDADIRQLNYAQFVTLEGTVPGGVSGVEGPVHTFWPEYAVDSHPPVELTVESLMKAGAFGLRVSGLAVPSTYNRGAEMVHVGQ